MGLFKQRQVVRIVHDVVDGEGRPRPLEFKKHAVVYVVFEVVREVPVGERDAARPQVVEHVEPYAPRLVLVAHGVPRRGDDVHKPPLHLVEDPREDHDPFRDAAHRLVPVLHRVIEVYRPFRHYKGEEYDNPYAHGQGPGEGGIPRAACGPRHCGYAAEEDAQHHHREEQGLVPIVTEYERHLLECAEDRIEPVVHVVFLFGGVCRQGQRKEGYRQDGCDQDGLQDALPVDNAFPPYASPLYAFSLYASVIHIFPLTAMISAISPAPSLRLPEKMLLRASCRRSSRSFHGTSPSP